MTRRSTAPPENHDRWLVSYADFITLLFAFFVVLFASTKADKSHARAVSESIEKALGSGVTSHLRSGVSPASARQEGTPDAERLSVDHPGANHPSDTSSTNAAAVIPVPPARTEELKQSLEALASSLRQELDSGTVRLSLEQRGLVIELEAGAFFAVGDDNISASAYPILQRLATVLNSLPNSIRLEGHTDSLPIRNSRFHSNWELSAARSIAMLRVLDENYGVDRKRMAIVGYGDTVALSPNDTEAGRLRNRRVDIVILNTEAMRVEPNPGVGAAPVSSIAHLLSQRSDLRPQSPDLSQNKH